MVSSDNLVVLYTIWVLSPTGAGSLVPMGDAEEKHLQFTATMSKEFMEDQEVLLTALDFLFFMAPCRHRCGYTIARKSKSVYNTSYMFRGLGLGFF